MAKLNSTSRPECLKRVIDDDDFEDFFINNKDFKVILIGNLLINRDHPFLIQN